MRIVLVPLAFALALAVPAAAEGCVPTTSDADVILVTPAGKLYWDDILSCSEYWMESCWVGACLPTTDVCYGSALMYSWIYQESNGIYGLQRSDDMVDDTCGGLIPADTIVY